MKKCNVLCMETIHNNGKKLIKIWFISDIYWNIVWILIIVNDKLSLLCIFMILFNFWWLVCIFLCNNECMSGSTAYTVLRR